MVGPALGRPLSSMGGLQSWVIVEIVVPVARVPGIGLSPGIIVLYGRLVERSSPCVGAPSVVLLGLFVSCPVCRSRGLVTAFSSMPLGLGQAAPTLPPRLALGLVDPLDCFPHTFYRSPTRWTPVALYAYFRPCGVYPGLCLTGFGIGVFLTLGWFLVFLVGVLFR